MRRVLQYASNAAWMAGERVLRIITSVFLLAFIARYLGPQQFGLFNYAIAIVALSAPLVALGLNRILVRDLVRAEGQQELIGTVFSMKLAVSIASVIALGLVGFHSEQVPEEAALLILVAAAGNLFMAFDVVDFYFQSRVLAKYTAIYKSIAFFVTSAVKLVLVFAEAPLVWFAVAHALEWALIAILGIAAYLRYSDLSRRWSFSMQRGLGLLRESWPEIGAGLATVLCLRLDQIMLEALLNIEAVGIYSAATRLSDLWYFVPTAIVSSVFPALVKSREQPGTAYHDDLQKLFLVSVAVAYAIAIATIIVAPVAVSLLFGEGYESGTSLLRLHILSLVAVSLGLCSGSWIFAEGRIILSLYRTTIGAATNAALNWLLIPVAGTQGAAIATVASLFVAFYVFDLFVPSMRPVFIMKSRAILLIGLLDYSRQLIARTRA